MRSASRKEVLRNGSYEIHIVGARRPGLRDLYHFFLRVPWWAAFSTIIGGYLLLNAIFAALYLELGGIANARPGSYLDAFFFSVQTMGTIGYGSMYPAGTIANLLVVAESMTGLVVTALATGLVFVRFSQTRARLVFSAKAAIGYVDGKRTLMVRVGNERRNNIVGTNFRLAVTRTVKTAEGVTMYRTTDLALVRDHAPALARAWMILHEIVDGSPLANDTPESLAAGEVELVAEVVGTDDTSLQPVHARNTWFAPAVVFDARLADILSETQDGNMLLDLRRFHDVVPAPQARGQAPIL
jgi:inward rectifier potassium channel